MLKTKPFYIVFFLAALLLFWGLGDYLLIDIDEPRYPAAAMEMIQRNNYLIPFLNGEYRFDKPILYYWFEIFSFKLLGMNEFSARLPSVLSGLALVALVYSFARTISTRLAWLSAMILATSAQFFLMSRMSVPDMMLNLCMCSTLVIFYYVYNKKRSDYWLILAGAVSGLGMLTKGPVAIAIPGLIAVVFLLTEKQLLNFLKEQWKNILLALLAALIVAFPWYYTAHVITDGAFTESFFFLHNIKRYTDVVSNHDGAIWFYIPVLLMGFAPWVVFLPGAIIRQIREIFFVDKLKSGLEGNTRSVIKFCLVWFLTVFIFFSISGTKLPNYILSFYLPLSVLIGYWLSRLFEDSCQEARSKLDKTENLSVAGSSNDWRGFDLSYSKFALLGLFLFFSSLICAINFGFIDLNKFSFFLNPLHLTIIFSIFGLGFLASLVLMQIKQNLLSIKIFVGAVILALITSIHLVLIPFGEFSAGGLKKFFAAVPQDAKVVSLLMLRPSAIYYAGRPVKEYSIRELKRALKSGEEIYFISKNSNLKKLKDRKAQFKLVWRGPKYNYGSNLDAPDLGI